MDLGLPDGTGTGFLVGLAIVAVLIWILRSDGRYAVSPAIHRMWQRQARFLLPFALAFLVLLAIGAWLY
jgi:hypothetical protein